MSSGGNPSSVARETSYSPMKLFTDTDTHVVSSMGLRINIELHCWHARSKRGVQWV